MTTKLTLPEKVYLVAVYGDAPIADRRRLFSISAFPVHIGSLVLKDGRRFLSQNREELKPYAPKRTKRRQWKTRL